MTEIEILFTTSKTPKIGAASIKWYLDTSYSHVAVRWYSAKYNRYLIYHAAHGSVHFLNNDRFLSENIIVHSNKLSLTQEQFKLLIQTCIDLSGIKYGYSELAKILIADIYYKINKRYPKLSNGSGYICSELLAKLLEDVLKIKWYKPKFLVDPKDIYGVLNG